MFRRAKKARAARRLIQEAPGDKILKALQLNIEYVHHFNDANLYAWDVCSDETKSLYGGDPKNLAPPDNFTIDLFRSYAAAAPPPDEILKALSN